MALEPITRQEKIIAGQGLTPITRMEKFLKEFGGSGGGGGIPVPETAEVGQTIVVKAVDENGKPTEWAAAELPSDWEVIASGELTEDATELQITLDNNGNAFSLKKGLLFLEVVGTAANTADRGALQFKHNVTGTWSAAVNRGTMTRVGNWNTAYLVAQYDYNCDENFPLGRCFYKADQDSSIGDTSFPQHSHLTALYITGITENAKYMGVGTKWKLMGVRK